MNSPDLSASNQANIYKPVGILLFLLSFAIIISLPELTLTHLDLGWHLATGELILSKLSLPFSDPWSFTTQGYRWLNPAWLWDVVAFVVYKYLGLAILNAIYAFGGGVVVLTIYRSACSAGASAKLSFACSLFSLLVILSYSIPDVPFSVSPQGLTLVIFSLYLFHLRKEVIGKKSLLVSTALFALWANLHGGFVAGFLLQGCFLAAAILEKNKKKWGFYLTLIGCSIVASLCTPLGLSIVEAILRTINHPSKQFITEWQALGLRDNFLATIFIFAFLLSGILQKSSRLQKQSVPLVDKFTALLFLVMALLERRHFAFFVVIAAPLIAKQISNFQQASRKPENPEDNINDIQTKSSSSIISSGVPTYFLSIALFTVSLTALNWEKTNTIPQTACPQAEVAFLSSHYPQHRLFNDWNLGGCLILEARNNIQVFIDGRAGTAYPPEVFDDYIHFVNYENWDEFLKKYDFNVAIFPNYRRTIDFFFSQHPEWERVLKGPHASIYIRKNSIIYDEHV